MNLHLTCTPTKFCIYFDSPFDTVTSEHALYKLLVFHVTNLMSILLSLGRLSKESIKV
jgi:hypothetical protein